jgi:cytochrome P450
METVRYNPFLPEVRANPYPLYHELRETDPFQWHEGISSWVLSRYRDVAEVLRDNRFSADRSRADRFVPVPRGREFQRSMLALDPPDHTRLRTLVNKAFTPRGIEKLKPRIDEIIDQLLDAAEERGRIDVITDLAYPLPVTVIAEMLGIPPEGYETFKEWSATLAASLDPMISSERREAAFDARDSLFDYLLPIIEERRRSPKDDLISGLVAAEERGDMFSEREVQVMINLLLIAGHETTVNLIGNGVLALLRNPDQLERLRLHPELIGSAIEELLRYDSPVQLTGRSVVEDMEMAGHRLEPGNFMITLLGAANRDPDQFPDPDRLDIARTSNHHFSFGRGIHFCLGAPLARLEGQAAIGSLVRRFPELRLDGEPVQRDQVTLRGLETLPVAL